MVMNEKLINNIEDSEYYWKKECHIKYYELDFNKTLKPSSLMNFLQDVATINAEMLGFGPSFVFSKNYAWFLIKYHMEFDDYPQDLDNILIKTESRGISKIIANRDFEIWNSDNTKRLGRIASSWMLIDLNTKSILPLTKIAANLPLFEKRENDLSFEKISPPQQLDFEKIFEIRYDDIDVNQHVNNSNYIVWAFETLPYEFKTNNKLKTLDIVYKKDIAFGHKIISSTEFDPQEKNSIHVLKNETTNEDLCIIYAQWTLLNNA